MRTRYLAAALSAAFAINAAPAGAAAITVVSYNMPNGDGQASGGTYNYWDLAYSGSGSTNVDGAPLSGGTGDLSDGFIGYGTWFASETAAGDGRWVGWYAQNSLNPVVTFNFTGSPTVEYIAIHFDNSQVGGVSLPAAILINGVSTPFTGPPAGSIGFVNFSGLGLTGNSLSLEFQQADGGWVFVSNVSFAGTVVPEPSAWAMLIAGFGLVGAVLRRGRRPGRTARSAASLRCD